MLVRKNEGSGSAEIIEIKRRVDGNRSSTILQNSTVKSEDKNMVKDVIEETHSQTFVQDADLNSKGKLTARQEEMLIKAVHKRRPLWDLSLPLSERTRDITSALWAEVSAELNNVLDKKKTQNKFKSLRDTHRRIIQNEQNASSTSRTNAGPKWKHYESMKFLRDSCLTKDIACNAVFEIDETTSELNDSNHSVGVEKDNIPDNNNDIDNDNDDDASSESETPPKKPRLRWNSSKTVDDPSPLEKIASAILKQSESMQSNFQFPAPPPVPEIDEIRAVMHLVELRLRRASPAIQNEAMDELFKISRTWN